MATDTDPMATMQRLLAEARGEVKPRTWSKVAEDADEEHLAELTTLAPMLDAIEGMRTMTAPDSPAPVEERKGYDPTCPHCLKDSGVAIDSAMDGIMYQCVSCERPMIAVALATGIEMFQEGGAKLLGPDDAPSEADAMAPGVEKPSMVGCDWCCGPESDHERGCPTGLSTVPDIHRDLAPPNIPLAIGSTWTGPDGTVYDVVAPGDVGERPRWWIGAHLVLYYERTARVGFGGVPWPPGPNLPGQLHLDPPPANRDCHDYAAFALVMRHAHPVSDALRDRVGESSLSDITIAEESREQVLNILWDLHGIEGGTLLWTWAVKAEVPSSDEIESLRLSLGETKSQLASAHAAYEASRKARDVLLGRLVAIVGYPSDVEDDRLFDTIETWKAELGYVTDRCIEIVDEHIGSMPTAGPVENIARIGGLLLQRRGVEQRISSIVAEHIVKTTGPEPALEGLGRIELALVEQQRALEKRIDPVVARQDTMLGRLERERMRTALAMWDSKKARAAAELAQWDRKQKKRAAKPARKPKSVKRKAGR